jgi:hypothetical protein
MNLLHRGFYMAPNTGGGGGADDLDWLLGDQAGAGGGDAGGAGDGGAQLTDAQLDAIADRLVQKGVVPQPAQAAAATQATTPAGPFGDNEWMNQMADRIAGHVMGQIGGRTFVGDTQATLQQQGLPKEVIDEVVARMSKMSGKEVREMQEQGGDIVLADALYGQMVRSGKLVPPAAGNAGEQGDVPGTSPNASSEVQKFVADFVGFNGRPPTKEDAARWGVKL